MPPQVIPPPPPMPGIPSTVKADLPTAEPMARTSDQPWGTGSGPRDSSANAIDAVAFVTLPKREVIRANYLMAGESFQD
jgi:hypothetical protein